MKILSTPLVTAFKNFLNVLVIGSSNMLQNNAIRKLTLTYEWGENHLIRTRTENQYIYKKKMYLLDKAFTLVMIQSEESMNCKVQCTLYYSTWDTKQIVIVCNIFHLTLEIAASKWCRIQQNIPKDYRPISLRLNKIFTRHGCSR